MFQLESYFSDIGGTLGLYLGMSFMSWVEFIELFTDLTIYALIRYCRPRRVAPPPRPRATHPSGEPSPPPPYAPPSPRDDLPLGPMPIPAWEEKPPAPIGGSGSLYPAINDEYRLVPCIVNSFVDIFNIFLCLISAFNFFNFEIRSRRES